MTQVGSSKLKKNFNEWAITSLIENTKVNEKPIMGWKMIAGKKETVEVIFHIIRKFRNEIVVRAVGPHAKATLADLSVGAQNLNFYLPEDLVLFQTEVKQVDTNGDVIIKIPEMIAQVDRRKHMRLFVEEGMKAEAHFEKENYGQRVLTQKFNKGCFDISAGGFSFIISKSESRFFQIGGSIERIQLIVDNKKMLVSGEIINIDEVEPSPRNHLIYKGWKVSVKYKSINPQARKFLNYFVFKYLPLEDAV